MRAVIRSQYGGPEVLSVKEQTTPLPNKDEVLMRVQRTTVNRTDCGILRGRPFLIRFFTGLRLNRPHSTPREQISPAKCRIKLASEG